MRSAWWAVTSGLVVLGCAQTQVPPSGAASAPARPDGGVPLASAMAPRTDPVVLGAPPLVHFDPSLVNPSIDPCTDMFAHVCSRWMTENPVPPAEAYWTTSSNLQIWNETVLRNALEEAARQDAQRSPDAQRIGDYWAGCVDEHAIDAAGLQPVAKDLKRIDGLKSKRALAAEIARLHAAVPGATGSSGW